MALIAMTVIGINYFIDKYIQKSLSLIILSLICCRLCASGDNRRREERADTTPMGKMELILINNTGISLAYNSFGLISATNLSYSTNSESDISQYLRFELLKESDFGCIQKLRGNGIWANVSFFSQRQINRNKIRYFHLKDKPNKDILELQISYNQMKAPIIHFNISFKTSKLQAIALNQLTINQDMEVIPITNRDLKFDTRPFPTEPHLIIYTILSLPSFGSLNLIMGNKSEKLIVGSFVTQKMIDEEVLIYNCTDSVYPPSHDFFDFEVATEEGLTNVEVTSFHMKFTASLSDVFLLTNEKLVVLEGDRATINSKLLRVETSDKSASLHFNITNKPKFGTIKLLNPQLNDVIQVSPDQLMQTEIYQNRVVYYHDDSENGADVFDFVAIDSNNNFICFGTFKIEIIMKNDNPPVRVVDRVFQVVVDGQKRLTASDIKYMDADIDSSPANIKYSKTYVPNGNLYFVDRPNVVVDQFTQQDIDDEKILFKHNGDESGRAILWITDGQFYASGVLEIKASKPYLRISQNTGLVVKYGESGLICNNNLTIESNLDISHKSEVTLKITSEPKFGHILNAGKETNRFTLQDLIDENIEYESKTFEEDSLVVHDDSFTFRLFFNGEDYVSSRVTAENQVFNISIYPFTYFQLSLININNITANEDEFSVIDSTKLLVSHQTLKPENILYLITQLPKLGALSLLTHNTTPVPMHFLSKNSLNKNNFMNETLLIFTQNDINDGLIHYKYSQTDNELKNSSYFDYFKFDVSNGITTLRDLTLYINIISKIITLSTGNITVTEGQSVVFTTEDFMVSNPFYANLIDEYLIVEEPKFGSIVFTNGNDEKKVSKSFTPKQIKEGQICYEHNGSETTRDWLTIVVRANSLNKESLPSTIHVMIEPINDETPHVVNNTGLELWEGTSAVLTNWHLAAIDDDSVTEDIVYQISIPSNGYFTTIDRRYTPIERFTQTQVDSGVIQYVHSGELAGGFRFQVTDGTNFDSPHVFTITAKPVLISVLVNKKLYAFPRMQQSVTREHLLVETNDGNKTRQFVYHIIKEPKFGRFLIENSDGSTKPVLSFTQKQINQNFVLYEQNKPINDILVVDEIVFDVETHFVQSLKGVKFSVEIAMGNSGEDMTTEMVEMIDSKPLTVIEGQFGVISHNNLNISKLVENWKKKEFNTRMTEKLFVKVQRNPSHGVVLYEGHDINIEDIAVPLSALTKNTLIYKHDSSNTFTDSISFGVYIRNGIDVLLINHTIAVNIIPVNDEIPILLTQNPRIHVIHDSKTLITNSMLRTGDGDGLPQNVIYEILTDPRVKGTVGYFMIEPNEEAIESFTQLQIDSNKVYFKQNGSENQQQIKFRIKDEKTVCSDIKQIHCTPVYTLAVVVRQLTLTLFNHTTVQLLQGSIKTKIMAKHLGTVSNDIQPENIVYKIKEGPIDGYIIVNDKTNNEEFTQLDINSLQVSYIQINKSSSDYFTVDIVRQNGIQSHKAIHDITVFISVKPLVRAIKPFLIASPGHNSYITSQHLDASDLALITSSVPKFIIKSHPKFGDLKKFFIETNNRLKRKTNINKIFIDFTNEDIMMGRIAYIADKDLDLSYPNEIITDVIHYDLMAHNVQTASGVLVVNIISNKLMTKSRDKDMKANGSDFDGKDIGMYERNNEMNYLNIIITRDHLLIAFVFIVVVILTLALIVIIRVCQSSVTHITSNKDHKSGPINTALNTSPAILGTPSNSDFGAEMLMMSHRLSPRSTPSVSDIDSGLIPIAPPTSPSLSTNCSALETRSRTATPRSLLRLPISDRLRGGCAAAEDLSPDTIPYNIYPLPPPSLYFGNEQPLQSTWGQSSVPLCKVPPIFPHCIEDHYCSSYHHSIQPIHQNNTFESTRVLGDGTSLVGSPVPPLHRSMWSSEDLNSRFNPSEEFNKSFMTSNDFKSLNSDIYITDNFSGDSLALQHNLGQTVPKQHYWV